MIIANLEDKIGFNQTVNRALRVMRLTIHTGLKVNPYELHHGRKPRSQLANIVKDNKRYLSGSKNNEHFLTTKTNPKLRSAE